MRALSAGLFLLLSSAHALAAEPETAPLADALELAEHRCMTKAELVANVQLWLGRPEVDRRIRITVEELDSDSLRFVVRREGKPAAERRFRTSDVACPDLRAAVALAIALAIDATVMQAILEPAPAEPAPPPPTPKAEKPVAPEPPVRHRPKPAPPRPEPVMLEAEAQALALAGVLPEPVIGGSIGAAVPLADSLSVRLSGLGTVAREVPVGTAHARAAMAAGQLSLCLDEKVGGPVLRGCAGAAAGRWSAEGEGFDRDRTTALPWAALVADLGATLPLAELVGLSARIHGYFPLLRPALEERDARGEVLGTAEPPPAGLGLSAGVVVGFR